jgi:2-methylfumaryl-CoA isomerase
VALTGLFTVWFTDHTADEIAAALATTSVLWERYRSFAETAADPRVADNPLFTALDQPRIGEHLAPGLPMAIDGAYPPAVAAPALGDDTAAVLADWLDLDAAEVGRLVESGVVATGSA